MPTRAICFWPACETLLHVVVSVGCRCATVIVSDASLFEYTGSVLRRAPNRAFIIPEHTDMRLVASFGAKNEKTNLFITKLYLYMADKEGALQASFRQNKRTRTVLVSPFYFARFLHNVMEFYNFRVSFVTVTTHASCDWKI